MSELARGDRVWLRHPEPRDLAELTAALERSRDLLTPWVDVRADPESVGSFIATATEDARRRLLVCRTADDTIAGVYNLSQIFYGPFRNAALGYHAVEPHAGQGYMREAMPLVLDYAFGDLGLHRLQAGVQPENERSIALLRATGWTEEGYARRYLHLSGDWRDHLLFAILADDLDIPRAD